MSQTLKVHYCKVFTNLPVGFQWQLYTWGWNQRATLGHPPAMRTESVPSQVSICDLLQSFPLCSALLILGHEV
jgi:hypothetical protein